VDTLRLDQVTIQNYRCFASCQVDLHPRLTVLVAENGQGKTALLDALTTALGPFVDAMSGGRQWRGIETEDVRAARDGDGMAPQVPVEIAAVGLVDGERLRWEVVRFNGGPRGRTSKGGLGRLQAQAQAMRRRLDGFARTTRTLPPPLPLVAHYGTGRLWSEERLTAARRRRDDSPHGRLTGYLDAWSSTSSFKTFSAWYGELMGLVRSGELVAAPPEEQPVKLLACVRAAVRAVLEPTGWSELDWSWTPPLRDDYGRWRNEGEVVVEHSVHGRLPLSRMSDGVRNTVALVADVARRCVRLNPQFGELAAQRTPGVLLIDEVDMHLHPGWQQEVLGRLAAAFPELQIIVSTHSPQVLTSVDVASVRVIHLHDGTATLEEPSFQTRGVESADVLAVIMGVDPVPRVPEAAWLREYRGMIEDGLAAAEEAAVLRGRLVEHFGPQHPVMLACDRLVRFQQFRLRRSPVQG
jgi:predicted ATP-binding protein involved in virulence